MKKERAIAKVIAKSQQRYERLSDKKKLRILKRAQKRLLRIEAKAENKSNDLPKVMPAWSEEKKFLSNAKSLKGLKLNSKNIDKRAILEDSLHMISTEIENIQYKISELPQNLKRGIASVLLVIGAIILGALIGVVVFYILIAMAFGAAYAMS